MVSLTNPLRNFKRRNVHIAFKFDFKFAFNFNLRRCSMGEADTDHMLRIPSAVKEVVGLHNRSCVPISESRAGAARHSPHCLLIVCPCTLSAPFCLAWPFVPPLQLNPTVWSQCTSVPVHTLRIGRQYSRSNKYFLLKCFKHMLKRKAYLCAAWSGGEEPVEFKQAEVYRKQTYDWKIRKSDGHECLRREYRTEAGPYPRSCYSSTLPPPPWPLHHQFPDCLLIVHQCTRAHSPHPPSWAYTTCLTVGS